MENRKRRHGFLEWAKGKKAEDTLSHSSADVPEIHLAVNEAYHSRQFRGLLTEDNQWGLRALKGAIAYRYGITDSEENPRVLLTPGASNAIYLICKTFLNMGDEVIIESPNYEPLIDTVVSVGAQPIPWYRLGKRFSLDLEALKDLITAKTKLILLSNLHNPSSELSLDSELQRIAEIVRNSINPSNIKIVVDEIYGDIAKNDFDSVSSPRKSAKGRSSSVVQLGDEFISFSSLSKVYGLSRLRSGWILGTSDAVKRLRDVYKIVVNIGSLDTEVVSSIVFENLDSFTTRAQEVVRVNREVLRNETVHLIESGILWGDIPEHGCTYFPRLPWLDRLSPVIADAIIDVLDRECGIAPGGFFGEEYHTHIRIGLGGAGNKFYSAIRNLSQKLESLANGGQQ